MAILKMTDLDLRGKRVLIRVDFNVPAKDGNITDDTRIRAALPGIRFALDAGARVMVTSHFGRPKEGEWSEAESLAPVARHLSALLGAEVPLMRDWVDGVNVEPGKVVLLENCRFNKGEKKNDDALAQNIAALCDIYVNDAFGTAHRAEATTYGTAKYAADRLRRPADGGGTRSAGQGAGCADAPAGRDRGRLQSVHQAHYPEVAGGQGGSADRRRRHRQHLHARGRPADRQVAGRSRSGQRSQEDHGGAAKRAAPRCRFRPTSSRPRNSRDRGRDGETGRRPSQATK